MLNGAAPPPEISFAAEGVVTETAAETVGRYKALSSGMIGALAICLVAGGLLAWRVKSPSIGDYLKLSMDAGGARTRADEILRSRGLDPNSYHHATLLANTTDPETNEFLRERVGVAGVNEIYKQEAPGALWKVRYFRDSQAEEYAVVLKPDGSLHSVHHTLSEDAPGASLSKEQAAGARGRISAQRKEDRSGAVVAGGVQVRQTPAPRGPHFDVGRKPGAGRRTAERFEGERTCAH